MTAVLDLDAKILPEIDLESPVDHSLPTTESNSVVQPAAVQDSDGGARLEEPQMIALTNVEEEAPQPPIVAVNCLLAIQDTKHRLDFCEFRRSGSYLHALAVYVVIITASMVTAAVFVFMDDEYSLSRDVSEHYFVEISVLSVTMLVACVSGWLVLLGKYLSTTRNHWCCVFDPWIPMLEHVFAVTLSLSFGLLLIYRSLPLHGCDNDRSRICNPEYKSGALPQETAYIVMMIPPLTYKLVRGVSWSVIIGCWVMCTFSVAFSVVEAKLWNSLGFLFFSATFSLMAMVEHHRQSLLVYIGHKRQEHLIEAVRYHEKKTTKAKAVEDAAVEMRHMIANVAHDLKTVMIFIRIMKCTLLSTFIV